METTKYNVDEALGNRRPTVVLRGEEYQVVDMPVQRRLAMELEYLDLNIKMKQLAGGPAPLPELAEGEVPPTEEQLAEQAKAHEKEALEASEAYQVLSVDLVLEDVPRETSLELGERELDMLSDLYLHWRASKITPEEMLGKPSVEAGNQTEQS